MTYLLARSPGYIGVVGVRSLTYSLPVLHSLCMPAQVTDQTSVPCVVSWVYDAFIAERILLECEGLRRPFEALAMFIHEIEVFSVS